MRSIGMPPAHSVAIGAPPKRPVPGPEREGSLKGHSQWEDWRFRL